MTGVLKLSFVGFLILLIFIIIHNQSRHKKRDLAVNQVCWVKIWWCYMMHTKSLLLQIIIVTGSFTAHAGEVYKTIDENGNVVFSDKKTQDAETVKVQPNVVDLDIPDMPVSTTQNKSNKQTSSNPNATQSEVGGWNRNTGSNLRRRVRTETNGEGVNRPKATAAPGGRAGGR